MMTGNVSASCLYPGPTTWPCSRLYVQAASRCALLEPIPIVHKFVGSELLVENEWITYHNAYANSPGGYDNVVRVITKGGRATSDGNKVVIDDAEEVLLLTGIEWHAKRNDGSAQALKERLRALPPDYQSLLRPHAAEHGEIFHRVTLNLSGGEDRRLTSEELLERAKGTAYKRHSRGPAGKDV